MSKFLRTVCCLISLGRMDGGFSQLSTATAFGDVTDPTGAQIPHATVVFTQTQTNFTRTTTTNGQGEYHASFCRSDPTSSKWMRPDSRNQCTVASCFQ